MTYKNVELYLAAALFGYTLGIMSNTKSTKSFDKDRVISCRTYDPDLNQYIWHFKYEDAEYNYEVTDVSFHEGMDSLRGMVLA